MASMGEEKSHSLVGKPKGGIIFGRCRHKWEENMDIDLKEMGW
jgi:hypothetical protein